MVAKKTTKKPGKLSVKKETVKDLDVKPGKAGAVRGGGQSVKSDCPRTHGCPKTTVCDTSSGCEGDPGPII